jgi:solute:Na+ symporter, SSS family
MFGLVDWLLLAGYLMALLAIGAHTFNRKSRLIDYFAGGRSMSWLPVAISIIASDTSAVTILGNPGYSYAHDLTIGFYVISYSVAAWIVLVVFLPFYCRLNLYTAYEYLERRFDVRVRCFASALFLFIRGAHVSIAIYAASILLGSVTGLSFVQSILLMGCVTVLYTTLGGIRAVIWTDVLQFSIVVLGITCMFVVAVSHISGGFHAVWHLGMEYRKWRIFDWSLDATSDTTIWATLIGGTVLAVATLGTDQAVLQRYFTAKSEQECKFSLKAYSVVILPFNFALLVLGTVLFAFYRQNPKLAAKLPNSDAVLAYFATHEMAHVIAMLLVGCVFAASMGVMSAGINSLSTCTIIDFYKLLLCRNASERHYVLAGRFATFGWGALATAGAVYARNLGALALAFAKIQGYVGGVMLGVFLLAIFSRRVGATDAIFGSIFGLTAVTLVAFGTPLSLFWYGLVGCTTTSVFAWFTSILRGSVIRASSDYVLVRSRKSGW